jgi:PAS domain S-box-containing protein
VIIDWDPAFEKMIGYTREQMLGKRIRDLPFYTQSGRSPAGLGEG